MPQEFEATLDEWMTEFHTYLTFDSQLLKEKDVEKESILDALKSAVCQNINLFMEMNEEEFSKFLGTFVDDVWGQLTRVSLNPGQVRTCSVVYGFFCELWGCCMGPTCSAVCLGWGMDWGAGGGFAGMVSSWNM